jgi:hypothetical protein
MSVIVIVSAVGALGQYTSPIWMTRTAAEYWDTPFLKSVAADLGPFDPVDATPIRIDRFLKDGDGGIYWWMTNVLPGFRQFRYPSKLFTFTCLGLAALAGLGWDRILAGERRRTVALGSVMLVVSMVALGVFEWKRPAVLAALQATNSSSMFGPINPEAGCAAIAGGFAQASVVLGMGLAAIGLARRRWRLAGVVVLVATAADLGVANSRYVLSVPQAVLERKPLVVRLIEEAEKKDPSDGPFRVHRMPVWNPLGWNSKRSDDRVLDFVTWEHDTIQPKYGINDGIEFTHTTGVAELYDYEWFFNGFPRTVRNREIAKKLNVDVGASVIYFPRRAVDMWNTRYLVLPSYPAGWTNEHRGYAAYLPESEVVYPEPGMSQGPDGEKRYREWIDTSDFQILKNQNAYPRAWVVHSSRMTKPVSDLSRDDRVNAMYEIIYNQDYLWYDPDMRLFDPRTLAWVDSTDQEELRNYTKGSPTLATEKVTVTYPDPQHAKLEVDLKNPGIVVLSDIYYPGWELTIDGVPSRIYRVNRLMRGAAVPKGKHTLIYSYRPKSFRIGGVITLASLGVLLVLGVLFLPRGRGGEARA